VEIVCVAGTPRARARLARLAARGGEPGDAVERRVRRIVAAVRRHGDRALLAFTRRLDGVVLTARRLRVPPEALAAAYRALPAAVRRDLVLAARRIRTFHRRQRERSWLVRDAAGARLGQRVVPLERVGIYVPGGRAAYPSTVLMTAIPARVAGVRTVIAVSPAGADGPPPAVLAACHVARVDALYRIGGAQAIAALAYGTRAIAAVDKIVGPGNAYVQAAKRMVYGVVDIDKMAGPSEVVVIADEKARPAWIAADLIAQAEHGSGDEAAILITPVPEVAEATAMALRRALLDLPRAAEVRRVMARRGAAIVVENLEQACALANRIGPEHLELDLDEPHRWLSRIESAGAIFIGGQSPAPLGDYLAGPNHVLPTGGSARFASPLGAYDFLKRTSIIEASARGLAALGATTARLARLEGFEGHARAVEVRLRPPL